MVDVYSTEAERRAALEELTALRRELKTETAKGAKAAKSDPRFIAAQQRLDAAKSAAGMRTAAQDLAALNRTASVETGSRAERAVTKELNAPSKQYFKQVQQAYKNPDIVPNWKPSKTITPDILQRFDEMGWDASKARYDWVLIEDNQGRPRWAMGVIGALEKPPAPDEEVNMGNALNYANRLWRSDSNTIGEINQNIIQKYTNNKIWPSSAIKSKNAEIYMDELVEALPELKYSQFQEIIYQLTLEKDEDITIEDILDKYDEMYGEG